jgi:hypothetical protein
MIDLTPNDPSFSDSLSSPGGEGRGTSEISESPRSSLSSLSSLPSVENSECSGPVPRFYPARLIAAATQWDKKTIHRTAVREAWPSRQTGNRFEYAPPEELAQKCAAVSLISPIAPISPIRVTFQDLTHDEAQRRKVLLREEAVKFFKEKVAANFGIEFSLSATVTHIYRRAEEVGLATGTADDFSLSAGGEGRGEVDPAQRPERSRFGISTRTLRTWIKSYEAHGLNGLVEQKQGAAAATAS